MEFVEIYVEHFEPYQLIVHRLDEHDPDEMENYDLFQLKNQETMMNNDSHQNEINDYVLHVDQYHQLDHEHQAQNAQDLMKAKEENLLWVEEGQEVWQFDWYLLVKIYDILDMWYPVLANFEDNFDEINDHLKI